MDITAYLKLMLEKKGERLILKIGSPPLLRLAGQDKSVGKTPLDLKVIKHIAFSLINVKQKQVLIKYKKLEYVYTAKDGHQFDTKIETEGLGLKIIILPKISEPEPEKKIKHTPEEPPKEEEVFLDLGMSEHKNSTKVETFDQEEKSYEVLGKAPDGDLDIFLYLKKVVELKGSDLFLTVNSAIKAKISGRTVPLDKYLLTEKLSKLAAFNLMNSAQKEEFEATKDLDFAVNMPFSNARFRVNAFYQRGTIGLVMRFIPPEIPKAEDLGLPEILLDLVMAKRGLLLMVGGTGSGKTSSLAAIINHRNANVGGHILTIEDPIEFSHPNLKSIVNQREVGVDTVSYAKALKASLREAPNVVLIGEIRDRETMEAALELANTGHLCISTLHANNANQAMERIVNMFPHVQHKQLFMDLSTNLNAVVSQRLVPTINEGLCVAVEVMINTPHISSLILKGELNEIKNAMASSATKGMKTFDDALYDLYKAEKISLEEALKNADSRNDLEAKLNFG